MTQKYLILERQRTYKGGQVISTDSCRMFTATGAERKAKKLRQIFPNRKFLIVTVTEISNYLGAK
jgi:hypothetical protein